MFTFNGKLYLNTAFKIGYSIFCTVRSKFETIEE